MGPDLVTQVGFLLFPGVQQLDATAPYEAFATWGGAEIRLIWKHRGAVVSSTGLGFTANASFDDCPPLDVICVPPPQFSRWPGQ